MSYVHFLDVFDPTSLPAGLADKAAAKQARGLRLSAPSPGLVALLSRIRQLPPSIAVNVVGGVDQQPVEWVAGEPPQARGDGANCALWTLILPVDEDIDALPEAVTQIEAWAQSLGLRVYDETQEALTQPLPTQVAPTGPVVDGQELPAPGDILVLNWGSIPVTDRLIGQCTLRQVVQQCLLSDRFLEHYDDSSVRRLLVRLLQHFPYETHGQSHWCGRHPVTDPLYSKTGLRLLRVASEHRTEMLKCLLPLSRELFLTVVLHDEDFYVERNRTEKEVRTRSSFKLHDWDPDWSKPRWTPKQCEKQLFLALRESLPPYGFEHLPDKVFMNIFARPLRVGGGRQVIRFGSGLDVYVQSERMLSILQSVNTKMKLADAYVLKIDRSNLVQLVNLDECVWRGGPDSPEEIAWAVDDIKRLLLPLLDRLHTAGDLWQWLSQPRGRFPGVADLSHLREWSFSHQNFFSLTNVVYAARCMPDDVFQPLLQVLRQAAEAEGLKYPEHPGISNTLKMADIYAQMPQTPIDAPL